MKLLTISFEDTVDTSTLLPGVEVEVKHEDVAVTGKVMSITTMENPSLEGDYHITSIKQKEDTD